VRYRFAEFDLDARTYTLTRAGHVLALQPKVFDVLRFLIEHRDRVVTKDELLDAVWPNEHGSESAVVWSISHARRALGQDRGQKQPIETVHGRGYRFTARVEPIATTDQPFVAPPAAQEVAREVQPRSLRPFVGRIDVMRNLDARLAEAEQGRGQLCLLSGEPGIGKTRCAEELIAHARARGDSAWIGRAVEGVGAPVFWPWIQIVRAAVRDRPQLRADAEALLSRLSTLDASAASGDATERSGEEGRFWLLDSLSRLLLEAAQQTPLLLLIDDVQWADSGSGRMLQFLAPELPRSRILIVATQRDEPSTADDRLASWLSRHAARIELQRLTVEDIGRYIGELTATQPSVALSTAVHRATAGNPLFVQETVRGLIFEHGDAALASLEPATVKPPEAARDVLRMQLSSLASETRVLLSQASVLGESFELSLLGRVSGHDADALLAELEVASKRGFVVAETPDRYRFSHAQLRALLYEDTPAAQRVALHRRAAELLAQSNPPAARYAEIALHYYRSLPAGDYGVVTAAVRRAAAAAVALFAHEDALRLFEWALEAQALDPAAKPRARSELLFAYASAQRNSGRDLQARATLARMFELARQYGDVDLLLRGARALRPTYAMSSIPDPLVRDALEEVLRSAPEDAREIRAVATAQLACVPPYAIDMQKSKQLSARALELARQSGAPNPVFEALRARLYSLSGPDDIDALLAVTDEILELDRARPTWHSAEAYTARYTALLHRGDMAEADHALAAFRLVAERRRLPEAIWYHDRVAAQRRILSGEFAAGQAACDALRARGRKLGLSYANTFTDMLLGRMATEQHGIAKVTPGWDLARMLAPRELSPAIRSALIRIGYETDRAAAVQPEFQAWAASDFADLPKDITYLCTLGHLARAAVIGADRPRADKLYALLLPYAHFNAPDGMLFYDGAVAHPLALLAECLGRNAEAEKHFEDAITINTRIGHRPQLARTRHAYALFLRARSDAASQQRSRELAAQAVAEARALDMTWLLEQASKL
jgi:DNA-binding winged helix-turn-helix (wHTH) protein